MNDDLWMKYFSTTERPVGELIKPTDYPLPYSITDNYQLEYPTNPSCYWSEEPTTNSA